VTQNTQIVRQRLYAAGFPASETDVARVAEAYPMIGGIVDILYRESTGGERSSDSAQT
jgi:hypothetical protein